MAKAAVPFKMVVLLLLLVIVTPILGVCNCSMFCCTLLYVHSSFAIILMEKRERERESADCFAKFVFLVSHDCCVAHPRGAVDLSAVCYCSNS